MRKLNEIFGYGLFIVGILKILLVILVLIQVGTNITAIFNGGSVNSEYYPVLSTTIGFAQLILAVGSIIMIILNIKKQPEVITGYLYGLGALLLEFIIPPIMSFYFVFVECGLYMKAGTKIKNTNLCYGGEYRNNKERIKNTEWFYSDKNEQIEIQRQQRMSEIEKENYESRELSDLIGDDTITYDLKTDSIKENKITIILVILIIIIFLSIGVFCWKVLQVENVQNNIDVVDMYISNNNNNTTNSTNNGEIKENIMSNNSYINMSKYYLSTNHGKVAEIYNNMLDSLGKQKYIIETSNGSDCIKSTIDLNKMCFLSEYENFYECWAYTGGLQKKYKYNYSTGETEKNSEVSLWMKSDEDFVAFAVDFEITDEDYKWNYGYNENVSRNGYQCYEIVANWNGDFNNYSGENVRWDGIRKLYIDMETYKLIEYESSAYINDTIGYSTYSNFYEYSDNNLEIPKDAENYIYN